MPAAKSNPTHPRPRLCGSAIGRPWSTGAGIADRHHVVLPVSGELLDAGDHLLGVSVGPDGNCSALVLSGGEDLDVGSADIDDQHLHSMSLARLPAASTADERLASTC